MYRATFPVNFDIRVKFIISCEPFRAILVPLCATLLEEPPFVFSSENGISFRKSYLEFGNSNFGEPNFVVLLIMSSFY